MSNRKTKYITVLGFMSTLVISAQDTVRKVARDSSDIDVNYFEEGLTKRYSGNEFDYSINDTGGVNISENSESGRIDPDSIGDFNITTAFDTQSLSWQFYGEEQKIMQLVAGHTAKTTDESFVVAGIFTDASNPRRH